MCIVCAKHHLRYAGAKDHRVVPAHPHPATPRAAAGDAGPPTAVYCVSPLRGAASGGQGGVASTRPARAAAAPQTVDVPSDVASLQPQHADGMLRYGVNMPSDLQHKLREVTTNPHLDEMAKKLLADMIVSEAHERALSASCERMAELDRELAQDRAERDRVIQERRARDDAVAARQNEMNKRQVKLPTVCEDGLPPTVVKLLQATLKVVPGTGPVSLVQRQDG